MVEAPNNPGSHIEFADQQGLQAGSPETTQRHSEATALYRQQLAEYYGMTPEELHSASLGRLAAIKAGKLATAEAI